MTEVPQFLLIYFATFASFRCMQYVALKVQKSADHYTEAARDEIDLLQTVRANAQALKELAGKDPS